MYLSLFDHRNPTEDKYLQAFRSDSSYCKTEALTNY